MVDIAVVFGAYFDPDSFTFLHGLECLSDMLMLLQICHFKLFFNSSFLLKVDQLSIVKPCFVCVVNYVSFVTFSIELRGRSLHQIFDDTSILVLSYIYWVTDTLRLDRGHVVELIKRSLFTGWNVVIPFLFLPSVVSFLVSFLPQASFNSLQNCV